MRLVYNAIKTPDGTVLESRHLHDCDQHIDANGLYYMVDGGLDYTRQAAHIDLPAENLCVYLEDGHEKVREHATWGSYGVNGNEPLKYIRLMDMSTPHIEACLKNCPRMHPHFVVAFNNELKFRGEDNE